MANPTLFIALLAGVASFLSPCVLPLVPSFLGYLSGTSASAKPKRSQLFLHSVLYVLGFASVFALLGVLLATALRTVSGAVQTWLSRIGGTIIILFGLHLVGLLPIPFLAREHAPKVNRLPGYATSFLFGASFAVGWSPCVGAVLGSVLALAATQPAQSFALLLTYSLGLGIPFLLVGLFSAQALAYLGKLGRFLHYFNIGVGVFLIVLGILVFTQTLALVASLSPIV